MHIELAHTLSSIHSLILGDMDMTLPKMIPFDNPASPVAATGEYYIM